MPAWQLKYLFGVHYKDGTEFFQTSEDISSRDPTRSAFYDVNQEEVELFQLNNVEGHTYLVDLRDGHFEIDHIPFFARIPPTGAVLRLIFFRRHRRNFHVGLEGPEQLSHEVEYHFGWQTTVEGCNIQQTLILL